MMRHRATRIQPTGPTGAYKTYAVHSPADREVVSACEQAGCGNWLNGWVTLVDENTDLGRRQAEYIRAGRSGRTHTELTGRTGTGMTAFRFDAHQRCFAEHRTRPELYVVRGGDWRGNPDGMRRNHSRPADWVEDFAEHQDRVQTRLDKG